MITSRWHVGFTPTELPSPSTPLPFVAELRDDWEEWLRQAEVVPGTPFLLSPTLEYDVGDAWMKLHPQITVNARESRAFLQRVVRYLAGEVGIRQFLDVGTGLPTADNTHEVAQRVAPDARVVYVDNDHCKSGCADESSPAVLAAR
jgi:hypothetical protein